MAKKRQVGTKKDFQKQFAAAGKNVGAKAKSRGKIAKGKASQGAIG